MFKFVKMLLVMSFTAGLISGCSRGPKPPAAAIKPHELKAEGGTRTDNYYWLNQREDPEVLAYLNAENAYLDEMMAHTQALEDTLLAEMKGRIKQDDSSAPYFLNGFWYYTRYEKGGEYPLHCRRQASMTAPEQIMLDGNSMGQDQGYFALRGVEVSPDTKLVVYGVDTVGRRFYDLHVRDLGTGRDLADVIPQVTGNVTWALDNQTLFYARQDPETLRSYQILRHELGTDPAHDTLVYQEDDDTFSCHVSRTKSDRYLVISSDQTLSSESRILEADNPTGKFRIFQPRIRDLEYHIDHQGDRFLIRTNLDASNFRLMECPLDRTDFVAWHEVISHRKDVLLEDIDAFADWIALEERFGGLTHLRILANDGSMDKIIPFADPTWAAWIGYNPQMDSRVLRYGYTSLTTPYSTYDFNLTTGQSTLVKQQEVLGGFDPAHYKSEYLMVTARDGVKVPVSLVYRQGFVPDGTHPLLLYGYGSYGMSMSARFNSSVLSLLDRGFVYAIAHVRGGQEMGRQWYENGKLLHKKNTFTDFIDCGHYLIDHKYAADDKLFAMGGSAGGLLMGAVVNMDPDLWRGVVAHVPFVDVVTTMLDESIPLTTGEYDEWGNPHQQVYYDYMLSYSPYDNVVKQDYPAMLVTTGLHDSQVQYFEPAKWVAKLRKLKADDHLLLLKINMEAGHGGASGRFRRLQETALSYAFMLDQLGVKQ